MSRTLPVLTLKAETGKVVKILQGHISTQINWGYANDLIHGDGKLVRDMKVVAKTYSVTVKRILLSTGQNVERVSRFGEPVAYYLNTPEVKDEQSRLAQQHT